jgi:hypothetical protein
VITDVHGDGKEVRVLAECDGCHVEACVSLPLRSAADPVPGARRAVGRLGWQFDGDDVFCQSCADGGWGVGS